MKHLGDMKRSDGACPWYGLARNSGKRQSKWLRWWAIETYFQAHYGRYDRTIAEYETPPPPGSQRRFARLLHRFYEAPPREMNDVLIGRRHEHQLMECPFCGHPLRPDTLDHFLPKEHWPEYSIFPNNLVPQCRGCMTRKGQRFYCKDSKRALFLHPIYHPALATLQFRIDVALTGMLPTFKIGFSVGQDVSTSDMGRISRHLVALDVHARMQAFCLRQWSHWKQKAISEGIDIEVVFKSLLGPRNASPDGRNWDEAFMKGICRQPAVLAWLRGLAAQSVPPPPAQLVVLVVPT